LGPLTIPSRSASLLHTAAQVGVGNDAASTLAAALTWMLRDGAGMVGRIVFAWAKASSLDRDARFWRLVADVLNDAALMLDILSPAFPRAFLALVCVSSVLKAVVGVAGGATRMALTQHQARQFNHADVAAKDGSQETAVNLAALLAGLALLPAVHGQPGWVWAVFVAATLAHIYANYRAVKAVVMESFDEQRLRLLAAVLDERGGAASPADIGPLAIARRERLWFASRPAHVGCRIAAVAAEAAAWAALRRAAGDRPYVVGRLTAAPGAGARRGALTGAVLRADAPATAVVEACVAAHLLERRIAGQPAADVSDAAADVARVLGPPGALAGKLEAAGWRFEPLAYPIDAWRAEWN